MSSHLPLSIPLHCKTHLLPVDRTHFDQFRSPVPKPPIQSKSLFLPKAQICCSSSSPLNSSGYDREESRWLREEQRWHREEQRWLREEQRWIREREALLREISDLKLRIESLEKSRSQNGVSVSDLGALLQVLREKNVITETESGARPMAFEEAKEEEKEVAVEEVRVLKVNETMQEEKMVKRRTLRKGSEGEDVRVMQEALQKLGFYCGEEDMEYLSFSTGTERAVKTWQATWHVPENGIMTAELLEKLYSELPLVGSGFGSASNADQKESTSPLSEEENLNGAAVSSVTDFSEIQQKFVKEEGIAELTELEHRVFLLGENRWEEPLRQGRREQKSESKTASDKKQCITCRGEGRLMCTECDGTGEPNVEPQFVEWLEDGAKCVYCDGLGYIICDVCEGKRVV